MKTFLIRSQTNYGEWCHIINAEDMEQASQLADVAGAWPGFAIEEVNTSSFGVVATCGGGD